MAPGQGWTGGLLASDLGRRCIGTSSDRQHTLVLVRHSEKVGNRIWTDDLTRSGQVIIPDNDSREGPRPLQMDAQAALSRFRQLQ